MLHYGHKGKLEKVTNFGKNVSFCEKRFRSLLFCSFTCASFVQKNYILLLNNSSETKQNKKLQIMCKNTRLKLEENLKYPGI